MNRQRLDFCNLKNERLGHEVHLKKRPVGSVKVEDFELVKVEIPEIKLYQDLVTQLLLKGLGNPKFSFPFGYRSS